MVTTVYIIGALLADPNYCLESERNERRPREEDDNSSVGGLHYRDMDSAWRA